MELRKKCILASYAVFFVCLFLKLLARLSHVLYPLLNSFIISREKLEENGISSTLFVLRIPFQGGVL